jgi:hypothetical protein
MKNKSLIGAAILFTIASALWLLNQHSPGMVAPHVVQVIRWAGIGALCLYGIKKRSLTVWIFISMFVGASLGNDWPAVGPGCRTVSLIFLRLVKTLIAPLIFAMVVQGIAQHSDLKKTGRMGLKAIIYFEIVTTIAIFIGLVAIQITKPGVGIHLPSEAASLQVAKLTASSAILNVFPENIGKAVTEGQTLQILVFSLLFGIGLAMAPEEKRTLLLKFCDGLGATMFKVTNIVMMFAPFGVGAAIANSVSHTGLGVLLNMAKLVLTIYDLRRATRADTRRYVANRPSLPSADSQVREGSRRTVDDSVCDDKFRTRHAASHGKPRSDGSFETCDWIGSADWVHLEPRRLLHLPLDRNDIRRTSCRNSPEYRAAVGGSFDTDAGQQGGCEHPSWLVGRSGRDHYQRWAAA